MRQYAGNAKIAAFGPCNKFGDGWVLMNAIKYGIDDSILVAYMSSDGKLYNAHWCIIHTDCKSSRCYVNIYRHGSMHEKRWLQCHPSIWRLCYGFSCVS